MKPFEKYFPKSRRRQMAFNELSKLMRSHSFTTSAIERAVDALKESQPGTRQTIEDGLYHFAEAARIESEQINSIIDIYEVDDEDNEQTQPPTSYS